MKKTLAIIIEDISDGKGEAFAARFPQLHDSIAMGEDMNELFEGIDELLESCRSHKMASALKVKEYVAMLDFFRSSIVHGTSLKDLTENIHALLNLAKKKKIAVKTLTISIKKKSPKTAKNIRRKTGRE